MERQELEDVLYELGRIKEMLSDPQVELVMAARRIARLYEQAGYPNGDSYEGMADWVAGLVDGEKMAQGDYRT